jgi:uncharacterized membrane protein
MNWFTSLGPPLFFWVMLGIMIAAFAVAIAAALPKRYRIAIVSAVPGIGIGLLILVWGGMGAFCVAPPGSACA